jgi:hypothetical protein
MHGAVEDVAKALTVRFDIRLGPLRSRVGFMRAEPSQSLRQFFLRSILHRLFGCLVAPQEHLRNHDLGVMEYCNHVA